MINSIELKNFKAFKNSGQVNLKKVNLFVGPNSSGKSSFIESLVLLKRCIECMDQKAIFSFSKERDSYENIVFDNDIQNKIAYRLSFNKFPDSAVESDDKNLIKMNEICFEFDEKKGDFTVDEIEFSIIIVDGVPIVDEFTIEYGANHKCHIYRRGQSYCAKLDGLLLDCDELLIPHKFYFKLNEKKLNELSAKKLKAAIIIHLLLLDLEKKADEFSKRLIYIESLRTKIERAQSIKDIELESSVGSMGENLIKALLGINRLGDVDIKNNIEENITIGFRNLTLETN